MHQLTKQGYERLKKEHELLRALREGKVRNETPATWHSEEINPEYLAFQEDLTLLNSRIAEYEEILASAEIIPTPPPKRMRGEVRLGATVTLQEAKTRKINEYTLLGTLEANPMEGRISVDSPVGRQLLGKKEKEEVVINSPIRVVYRVKKITYGGV